MKLFPKETAGKVTNPSMARAQVAETIEAEGFKITNKGDIIEFLGKTKISLPGTNNENCISLVPFCIGFHSKPLRPQAKP